jgi:hypothetical protein
MEGIIEKYEFVSLRKVIGKRFKGQEATQVDDDTGESKGRSWVEKFQKGNCCDRNRVIDGDDDSRAGSQDGDSALPPPPPASGRPIRRNH